MTTMRIVVADDHAVVRAGVANALREIANIEIVGEAGDGHTLLAILDATCPDLLVTDVTMPNFEPISIIRQIRGRFPMLKILVISAYDDDVYVQGLLSAGVHGYHMKDQPLSDLRLAVQRVLAGEYWVSSSLVAKLVHAHEAPAAAQALSARQRDILRCLQEGLDNQTIARRTGLSVKTIENHLTRLYRQINVQSRLEAVNYLMQHPEAITEVTAVPLHPPSFAVAPPPILIVDDNTRYRTQMRRMVGKSYPQAQVYEAENIQSALQLVIDIQPQLVFVDVVLSDESGLDCVRQIKALAPATRIVLISAYPDREFHRIGMNIGAVAFLDKKDLNGAVLHEVIADLLG